MANKQNEEAIFHTDEQELLQVSGIQHTEGDTNQEENRAEATDSRTPTVFSPKLMERLSRLEQFCYEHNSSRSRSRSNSVPRPSVINPSRSPSSRHHRRSSRRNRSRSRRHRPTKRSPRRKHRRQNSTRRDHRRRYRSRSSSQSDQNYSSSAPDSYSSSSDSSDRSTSRDSHRRNSKSSSSVKEGSFPFNGDTYIYFNKKRHSHVGEETCNRIRWETL